MTVDAAFPVRGIGIGRITVPVTAVGDVRAFALVPRHTGPQVFAIDGSVPATHPGIQITGGPLTAIRVGTAGALANRTDTATA